MKLNNIWGYGSLFGYSAFDGPNRYYGDFVAMTMKEKITFRFEMDEWIKVRFPFKGKVKFKAVLSDLVEAQTELGDFVITFADNDTLVGYSPILPEFKFEKKSFYVKDRNVEIYHNNHDYMGLVYEELDGKYKFCIHHSFRQTEARSMANYFINANIEELVSKRYAYYEKMPKCLDKKYEMLYYKCLQINKVNTHSAEGNIPMFWTTPDRVPHRHMWLWDSVFHALALVSYNYDAAEKAILAVLSQIRDDGFIAHMMNPTDSSDVTQPTVLAWGAYQVYLQTKNVEFLKACVNPIEKFLYWVIKNRDLNNNGLLEWFREPDYLECKCGESGLDNSPRFDSDINADHVDFSTWLANDSLNLSYIYKELGNTLKEQEWMNKYNEVKDNINKVLWNDDRNLYQDRLFDGTFADVVTPFNFFPMLANIPSKEQAEKLVKILLDKSLLWGNNPLSTINKDHPTYSNDMWRGGVWLNVNYFIMKGLLNYGYNDIAMELRNESLRMVNEWYKKTGQVFEFYDPENKVSPFYCTRKGEQPKVPDWRKHVHSITDYNWSACFTIMLIQNLNY